MRILQAASTGGKKRSPIARLPKGIGILKSVSGRGREFWRVRLGKTFTGGTVIKRDFAGLAEAKEWIFGDAQKQKASPGSLVDLKQQAGASAFAISPARLAEAADAFRRCDKAGLSLSEAVSFAIKHNRPTGGKIAIKDAITELIAWKRRMGKRKRYLEKLEAKLLRFSRFIPARTTLNEVTKKTVETYIASLKQAPGGEIIEMRHLSVLFGWGVKKGYTVENPVSKMERPKVERTPPTTLKPCAVLSLLRVANELTPWVVLGLFAGLRPEETQKLDWEDIDFSHRHVDLPAHKAKDRTRRIVPFFGNLEEWLLPYRETTGPVAPKNFRKRFWAMCERAGYRARKLGKDEPKTGVPSTAPGWPKDVLRHCFGSYHLAKWHSAGTTAEYMGHGDAKMLYNFYRDVIKDEAYVEAFWKLHPDQLRGETGNVVKGEFSAA